MKSHRIIKRDPSSIYRNERKHDLVTANTHILPMTYPAFVKAVLLFAVGTTQS